MKSAFFIKRREALHFLRGLSSVFGKKSGGIVTVQPSYSQKGEFKKIFSGSYPQKKRGTA